MEGTKVEMSPSIMASFGGFNFLPLYKSKKPIFFSTWQLPLKTKCLKRMEAAAKAAPSQGPCGI